jgi:hypothetical protein
MPKLKDVVRGTGEEIGSWAVHNFPFMRRLGRHFMELTEPNDLLLRWRIGHGAMMPISHWLVVPGEQPTDVHGRWSGGNAILGVDSYKLATALTANHMRRRPAVAYRLPQDSLTMVGVAELTSRPGFLQQLSREGVPSAEGEMHGVVMRIGEIPLRAAIGTADQSGRDFRPLHTEFLGLVDTTPDGLYRV